MKKTLGALLLLVASIAGAQNYSDEKANFSVEKNGGTAASAVPAPNDFAAGADNEVLSRVGTGYDWVTAGGAPTTATYITQTADGTLSAEQALGSLGTGLLKNTTTTGVLSIYAGNTCTNQFARSDTASGVWTCASVSNNDITNATIDLTTKVTGLLPFANIANGNALTLFGRSANSSGVMAGVAASAASDCVFHELSSALECGTVRTAGIANNAVTLGKLATQAAKTTLVNLTTSAAVPTAAVVQDVDEMNVMDTSVIGPYYGDFTTDPSGTSLCNSGTGSGRTGLNDTGTTHIGIITYDTGTTTTGVGCEFYGLSNTGRNIRLSQGVLHFKAIVRIPTLSDGTDTYTVRIGFFTPLTSATVTDGVYFEYTQATDTHWRVCARNASSATPCTNTTNTVTAGQWDTLEFTINAAANNVDYLINGSTPTGSPISTNIPTANYATIGWNIIKSAGTNSRSIDMDYVAWIYKLTSAR